MALTACVWQLRRHETFPVKLGQKWLSNGCFSLGGGASKRRQVQPCAKAAGKPAGKGKNTLLKGYGNPIVMRRIIDDDDNDDDDFLVQDGGDETEEAKQHTKPGRSQPSHIRVQTAEYISSSTTLQACPADGLPEFAIIGRSNVGKSSLINMLTKSKNLALTSKQPGKTRCINHFLINNSWYLVDLPGYGYAKASQDKRIAWNEFTKTFFLERQPLVEVLLLIDSSVPPQQIDFECAMWLSEAQVPFSIIFTKVDKAKKKTMGIEENVQSFCHDLELAIGRQAPSFLTSAATGGGAAAVLFHIATLRQQYEAEQKQLRVSSPLLVPQRDEG